MMGEIELFITRRIRGLQLWIAKQWFKYGREDRAPKVKVVVLYEVGKLHLVWVYVTFTRLVM